MKKKIFLMLMLILSLGFLFSMFSKISFGFEVYAANTITEGNSEWILQIDGAVLHPINLTFNELMAMPQSSVYAELYCYSILMTSGVWTGVRLSHVLEKAEFDQRAGSVEFYAADGYRVSLSLNEDAIIAYEIDGQFLDETLRLVLPEANGDRWIAMITHIHVSLNPPSPPQSAISMLKTLRPDLQQQSPTPQPAPTPPPTPSPSPAPDPSPSPTTPATEQSNQNPFPLIWAVTAVATVAFVSAGLIVLFKKRR